VERVTKFTRSCPVASKRAAHVTAATIALLKPFKALVLSITAGNGKEFAYHKRIELGVRRVLCTSVQLVGAGHELEYEWTFAAVFSERDELQRGVGQRSSHGDKIA
jgi:hypothetical protein